MISACFGLFFCFFFSIQVVHNCNNFRFPTKDDIAQKWKLKLGITTNQDVTGMVCIHHFLERDLSHASSGRIALKPGAVPFLNLGRIDRVNSSDSIHGHACHATENALPDHAASSTSSSNPSNPAPLAAPTPPIPTIRCDDCDRCSSVRPKEENEISRLKNEYSKIKQELSLYTEKSKKKIKSLEKKSEKTSKPYTVSQKIEIWI